MDKKRSEFSGPANLFPRAFFLIPFVMGSFAFCLLGAGCTGSDFVRAGGYAPGVYEGTGRAYRGPLEVRVQVSPAGIENIEISRHEERYPGIAALEELVDAVLEYGSTDIDAVSGATFSSRGFFEAVEDALAKARLRE